MMTRIIQCAQCKTVDIQNKSVYYGRQGEPLGEWPLYYVGNPMEPHLATHYFCGPHCSTNWYQEKRENNAT